MKNISGQNRIAITGGLATGKSTVLQILKDAGYKCASADDFARQVASHREVRNKISLIANLGDNWNSDELRIKIFDDQKTRFEINKLMHPLIQEEITRSEAQFFEIPLLFESLKSNLFQEVWTVFCDPEVQRDRIYNRYGRKIDLGSKLAFQLPLSVKVLLSDWWIRTDCNRVTVQKAVCERANYVART